MPVAPFPSVWGDPVTDQGATNEMDLTDDDVREMALRNHRPDEVWLTNGQLLSVTCGRCGNRWPCPTVERLRANP